VTSLRKQLNESSAQLEWIYRQQTTIVPFSGDCLYTSVSLGDVPTGWKTVSLRELSTD